MYCKNNLSQNVCPLRKSWNDTPANLDCADWPWFWVVWKKLFQYAGCHVENETNFYFTPFSWKIPNFWNFWNFGVLSPHLKVCGCCSTAAPANSEPMCVQPLTLWLRVYKLVTGLGHLLLCCYQPRTYQPCYQPVCTLEQNMAKKFL